MVFFICADLGTIRTAFVVKDDIFSVFIFTMLFTLVLLFAIGFFTLAIFFATIIVVKFLMLIPLTIGPSFL